MARPKSIPLSERLRQLREQAGMTQASLAEASGVSEIGVKQIEQGRRENPRWDTMKRLAKALGASLDAMATEVSR